MASINWKDIIEAADEEAVSVPHGEYDVVCDRAEAGTTSTGKEKIKCVFHVEGGPYHGKSIYRDLIISPDNPKALLMVIRQLMNMGLSKDWIASTGSVDEVAEKLAGRRCQIKVAPGKWTGNDGVTRPEITILPAAPGQEPSVVAPPNGSSADYPAPPVTEPPF